MRQAKATDFYVSIQVVGTPDDCMQQIAELQKLTGLDHLVTEFSFGGMPHEEAELNMRLFADKVLPVLQRDTAFAPPQAAPAAAPEPMQELCSRRRDPDDGSRPMDHVRSIKFDRLRLIACQRMHAYQDWTYVRIEDRRLHAATVRMGQRPHAANPSCRPDQGYRIWPECGWQPSDPLCWGPAGRAIPPQGRSGSQKLQEGASRVTKQVLRCFTWVVTTSSGQLEVELASEQVDHGLEVAA